MKIIIIKTLPNKNYKHFIHYMQYLYWIADIILKKPSRTYYVVEPKNKSNGIYPKEFSKKILEKFQNVRFININESKNILNFKKEYLFDPWPQREGYFFVNNKIIHHNITNWFPNNKSNLISGSLSCSLLFN